MATFSVGDKVLVKTTTPPSGDSYTVRGVIVEVHKGKGKVDVQPDGPHQPVLEDVTVDRLTAV